jgi:hypothetical protein
MLKFRSYLEYAKKREIDTIFWIMAYVKISPKKEQIMKKIIFLIFIAFSINQIFSMNPCEKKENFFLEKITDNQDFYPQLNMYIDSKGNVIGSNNGHIYFKSDGVKPENITFSPDGKKIVYFVEDAAAKDVVFTVHNFETEKSIFTGVIEKSENSSQPYTVFVDNDTVYASPSGGYPVNHPPTVNNSFGYAFLDTKNIKIITSESNTKLRAFASIPAKSLLLAASDNSPYQIYIIDPKQNLIKKTGIISSVAPRSEATKDGEILAIGDFKKIKTYKEEKNNYTRLCTWKFGQEVSAFTFDHENRLIALIKNGDLCICNREFKASLILLNLQKTGVGNLAKKLFDSTTKLHSSKDKLVIKNMANQFLMQGDFAQEIEKLKRECQKEIEKRKTDCCSS